MRLSFYILREHIAPFLYSFAILTFLFVIDFLMKLLDSILSKGLDVFVIIEMFVLNLAWMLALSIPMSILVATLMAFGRLSSDNEVTACRSAGISPMRLLWPAAVAASFVMVGLMAFNHYVLPEANHRAASLKSDITRKRAPALITPGTLLKDFENYRIWVDSIDYSNDSLYGVKIYYWERNQPPRYMYSHQATMRFSEDGKLIFVTLFNGENHIVDEKNPDRYIRLGFKSQQISIENVDATLYRRDRNIRSDREMSVTQMLEVVNEARLSQKRLEAEEWNRLFGVWVNVDTLLQKDSFSLPLTDRVQKQPWYKQYPLGPAKYRVMIARSMEMRFGASRFARRWEAEEKQASKFLVEIHKKFSIPVACLIFVLIGGPLGMMARRGGMGMASILCMGPFLIYWICFLRGEAMADRLLISPWLSMWLPNILVGLIGLVLIWKMQRLRK